ncbi:MAG: LamG-like jellyroll fold domain-containing protein [Planctomycetota bacterium]|jgi:TolA-binding protein
MSTKTLLISTVLAGFMLFMAAGVCFADASTETVRAAAPNPAGLVAHYEFEGDAIDTSGFQPPANGALAGNPTFEDCVFGRGINLDGETDYVDCGNESYFDITAQITVAAWIKVKEFDKKFQTIIAKGDNSWRLARVSDTNNVEFACNGTAATRWTGVGEIPWAVTGTTSVNDGKWHHVAGVFDGKQLYLYIDGVLEAAKSAAKSIDVSSHNVFIGANAQVPGREWNGFIDDVRIYNYALSQAEIVSLLGENEIHLLSRFPATLYDIAKRYDGLEKIEEAKGVCQLILKQHPDSPSAQGAELYLARRDIMTLIKSKDFTTAQEELDSLISDFNDHPDYAESLCAIAQSYEWPRKFEKAESLYERAAQLDPQNPHVIKAQFNARKLHIFSLIKSEKYTEAHAAIDEFTTDFDNHPALPGILYWIAKDFEAAKEYEEAKRMYQQVAWQYPKSSHAANALMEASQMDVLSSIESGNDTMVQESLDNLIADFNEHTDLPIAILEIGERYYNIALHNKNKGLTAESEENLLEAIAIWERIITELPSSHITPEAYFLSAEGYRELDEQVKAAEYYQKVVDGWPNFKYSWHAQFLVARIYKRLKSSGSVSESEANSKIKAAYERILQDYPNSSAVHDALKWLNRHKDLTQGEEK